VTTPNRPEVVTSINSQALRYYQQGRYAEAEPLCKRALAIREKTLGPNHPDMALVLENMAALYRATGRDKKAATLAARAARIRANNQ